jgi:DNA-binding NtrC family response regulator
MPSTVLIVDDEPNIRRMLGSLLRAEGYRTREAGSALGALAEVQGEEPDAVLMYMDGGETGLDALPRLREAAPDLPVIMMSGRASLSDAVKATRLGAFHFIEKPLTPEAVLLTLGSALELRKARELNRSLLEELGDGDEMVGRSPVVEKVRQMIERVAPTDARVLLTGESGTGKEVAAAAIHRLSHRANGPFVKLNCAAIPRDLVESEMFGHEKGAFTGATDRRRGRFELASGGTLFLDEIGDLAPELQPKLLKVLETRSFRRLGGTREMTVDVRLVAATNRDLQAEVKAGRFREDLFYRLSVFPLEVPPLRDRSREDVLELAHRFLRELGQRHRNSPTDLSAKAAEVLSGYAWPGNVRELKNVLERALVLASGSPRIEPEHLPPALKAPGAPRAAREEPSILPLEEVERRHIERTLFLLGGNRTAAAEKLGISRSTLHTKIQQYGLESVGRSG